MMLDCSLPNENNTWIPDYAFDIKCKFPISYDSFGRPSVTLPYFSEG